VDLSSHFLDQIPPPYFILIVINKPLKLQVGSVSHDYVFTTVQQTCRAVYNRVMQTDQRFAIFNDLRNKLVNPNCRPSLYLYIYIYIYMIRYDIPLFVPQWGNFNNKIYTTVQKFGVT